MRRSEVPIGARGCGRQARGEGANLCCYVSIFHKKMIEFDWFLDLSVQPEIFFVEEKNEDRCCPNQGDQARQL